MLVSIAGWIAPAATIVAAMMTAANLGARVTGWGFVVFTLGSLCWSLVGATSGQGNLLASNLCLAIINLAGVWRWLGRESRHEDGGRSAENASRRSASPALFTASGIAGMVVVDGEGRRLGRAVEALIECATGQVSYVVVSTGEAGGIGESLRAVLRCGIEFTCDRLRLDMSEREFRLLPVLADGDWPAQAENTDAENTDRGTCVIRQARSPSPEATM